MPSAYQKASLKALLGLFLDAQGHALPAHTAVKSASSLSRFLNHYTWSTRRVIRTTRQAILQQIASHRPHAKIPIRILIDLTTLEKSGKFWQLSTPTSDPNQPDPWVRFLNGKRGLHLVVLYLVVGEWQVPWSFRVWRGKGYASPAQLGRSWQRCPSPWSRVEWCWCKPIPSLARLSFSSPFAIVLGDRSSVCGAIAPCKTVAASKTFTGMRSGVYKCLSGTSTIPSPSPGFGSSGPRANANCGLSPPPILILERIWCSWGASVGRLKAFSKLLNIGLGCIVLVKAPS